MFVDAECKLKMYIPESKLTENGSIQLIFVLR